MDDGLNLSINSIFIHFRNEQCFLSDSIENLDEAEEEDDGRVTFLLSLKQVDRLNTTSPAAKPAQIHSSSSVVDSEKEPDYRDVSIRTDVKVKELYDVEERLGT